MWWAICAPAKISTPATHRWWSTIPTRKLQGYDYAELAPLARYRHQPGNPDIARVLARDRNVHLTLDIRLQLRAQEILEDHLRDTGIAKGRGGGDGRRHRAMCWRW